MCHVLCAHHRIYLRKKLQKAEQIREDIWKLRFEKKKWNIYVRQARGKTKNLIEIETNPSHDPFQWRNISL